METLHGAGIAKKIGALSDSAIRSVSIVSPYIGRWPAVATILGGNWWLGSPLSLRVITDISTPSNVNAGTLKMLMDRGPVRSLPGVHAKVYVFDEQAVVTSANLTETAFTKRHEIGVYLDANEAQETIKRFEHWWGLSAPNLTEEGLVA
jgi:phospholipase D-like protein